MQHLHQYLGHLYVFRLVIEQGSFQGAANQLGLPRSSVSKKLAQLEGFVDQRLLHRSTRQLRLTDAGAALLEATETMAQLMSNTEHLILSQQDEAVGRVKISCSTLMGQRYLLPSIPLLKQRYPKITFQVNLSDRVVNLLDEGVDIAIRTGHLPDSSLVARRIGEKRWGWFASPDYLASRGEPNSPDDLSQHQCLVFSNQTTTIDHWHFSSEGNEIKTIAIDPAMVVDDGRTLVELATMGQGIVMIDPLLVRRELAEGKLMSIFQQWRSPELQPIHLVCLGRSIRSKAVEVVWQALVESLQRDLIHP
ncbi:LysR substrate-binding domain-containing protein [Microbulbifer sp. PAAF003]|uniref:LysR substrate-binding domain-containing protein n=1 Tax=Microbulbifer sp. PAAF003 TaxID=3243375 RepID=UPI0040399AE4